MRVQTKRDMSLFFNEVDLLFCQIVQDTNLENTEDSCPTCEVIMIVDFKKHALIAAIQKLNFP